MLRRVLASTWRSLNLGGSRHQHGHYPQQNFARIGIALSGWRSRRVFRVDISLRFRDEWVHDSNDILHLETPPKKLAVVGGEGGQLRLRWNGQR